MKKVFIVFSLLLTVISSFSQIKPNERLVYAASYNMSGLMTHIAQVTMQTQTVQTSKKAFLRLSWEAATFSKWDSFFKIRDLYESYVDPATLRPSLYKRSIFEGGYSITEKYIFNPDHRTVNATKKVNNRAETKNLFAVGAGSQDIISMVYKLRTLDLNAMKPGQSKSFVIVFDQKEYPVAVKMLGREIVSAGNLGKRECFKMAISAKTNKLKGADKNLIWLTSDAKRIPVLVKFSIPVGTGQIVLSSATGI
ncbi:MAG: DUF3108 domain-containing protein [Paludibacter sp.]